MRFLSERRVSSNMRLAAAHLTRLEPPPGDLKRTFIQALNAAQSTSLRSIENDLYLEFGNQDLVSLLVKKTVFSPEEVGDNVHFLAREERAKVTAALHAAKDLIARADPNLYHLMTQIVGSVAIYRIPDRDGGSVSCCIGLIWLSPHPDWTVEYYGEMLVHEFVHNSVFLEDMVRGIMPEPDLLGHEDALSLSAIRQTRRPYDKAFHSACVAASLMYYYHALGKCDAAAKFFDPLTRTVDDLCEHERLFRAKELNLLTENGREMLEELRRFIAQGPDYSMIADALARS